MRITDISTTKKGRFSLFVDGKFLFSVDEDTFYVHRLQVGQELDIEQLEEIRRETELRFAKDRCFRLLGIRSYTRHQLFMKLTSYVGEDTANEALDRMEELGLVNDAYYACSYARDQVLLKGYAPARIARELEQRGVDRELIDDALGELDLDPEKEIAKIVCRRFLSGIGEEKGCRKAVDALARMGYQYGDVRQVLYNLKEDPDYYTDSFE